MVWWAALVPVALWAIDKMTEGDVSGKSSIDEATAKMGTGMDRAAGTIQDATKEAMGYNAPYMNPEVFKRMSELVQSGAFQQPFQKSFQAHQWNTPGMQFNPNNGSFGMTPWSTGQPPPSFTPQGLPPGMTGIQARPPVPGLPPSPVAPPAMPNMPNIPNRGPDPALLALGRTPPPQLPLPQMNNPVLDAKNIGRVFNPMIDRFNMYGFNRTSGPFDPRGGHPRSPSGPFNPRGGFQRPNSGPTRRA